MGATKSIYKSIRGRQLAFLREYAQCGQIELSAKRIGVDKITHYRWLANHPEYVVAFEQAREIATDWLEDVCTNRATAKNKPSDVLLMFLLNGNRPDKYRPNAQTVININKPPAVSFKVGSETEEIEIVPVPGLPDPNVR